VAEQVAQHVAEEFGVEQLEDLWRLTTEDLAAVEAALKLKRVFADKLKEAVKAAQVLNYFSCSCRVYYESSEVLSCLRTSACRLRRPTANMYQAIMLELFL
jgi:hypothetical protein